MSTPLDPGKSDLEELLGRIADEYAQRCAQGESPTLEEYIRRYPELAPILRDVLPAVHLLHQADPKPNQADPNEDELGTAQPSHMPGVSPSETEPQSPPSNLVPSLEVPNYEILEELGRGGMGVVYKARQVNLDRIVALKMIRSADLATDDERARFRREALATAALHHPNIVQIHEVGEHGGQLFFALEFVLGGTLATKLQGQPQPPTDAALFAKTLATAIHAAHEKGVIHRDLKPANVLLSEEGTLKVTDFGLAKTIEDSSVHTETGVIVGTPCYLAPEQAWGKTINLGPEADIYSLGVILYEMLTGRPPFHGSTILDTLLQVRNREPISPRRLQPGTPRDLETICLKCLHKEPTKRYPAAQELQHDLEAFLEGQPITARPLNVWQRWGKWIRRRPAQAIALGLSVTAFLALVGLVVGLFYAQFQKDAKEKAEHSADLARKAEQRAKAARQQADLAKERADAESYGRTLDAVFSARKKNDILRCRELLAKCPEHLREWEWHYLASLCRQELLAIEVFPFSPNRSLQKKPRSVLFTPDGRQVLSFTGGFRENIVRVWDVETGNEVFAFDPHKKWGQPLSIQRLALSASGRYLAVQGARGLVVWDYPPTKQLLEVGWVNGLLGHIEFSPEEDLLACTNGAHIKLLEIPSGKVRASMTGHDRRIEAFAFSSTGELLASGDRRGRIELWNTKTGKQVSSLRGHHETITDLTFHEDDKWILSSASTTGLGKDVPEILMWLVSNRGVARRHPYVGHQSTVTTLKVSKDQKHVAAGYADGMIVVWDVGRKRPPLYLRGHAGKILDIAFHLDNQRLASVSTDGTLRLWSLQFDPEMMPLVSGFEAGQAFRVSPDWSLFASTKNDAHLDIWDSTKQETVLSRPLPASPLGFSKVGVLSPDNKFLAGSLNEDLSKPGEHRTQSFLWLMDIPKGTIVRRWKAFDHYSGIMACSADSCYVAVASGEKVSGSSERVLVKVWSVADDRLVARLRGRMEIISGMSISPDGRYVAVTGGNVWSDNKPSVLSVWDVKSGKRLHRSKTEPRVLLREPTFSPDSSLLAVGEAAVESPTDHSCHIRVMDVKTGSVLHTLWGHSRSINSMVFSPNGKRLVSVAENEIRFWDSRSGVNVFTMRGSEQARFYVRGFDSDGAKLLFSTNDRSRPYLIFDSRPLEEVRP